MRTARQKANVGGYLIVETLVYLGVLLIIMGIAYEVLYRCIDNCVVLHRDADAVSRALHAGERWRADVRLAGRGVRLEAAPEGQILHLEGARHEVEYRYANGDLYRRADAGPWSRMMERVKSSVMESDPRPGVTAWRWELELQPEAKGSVKASRVRPLFTFLAVPPVATPP
jgi:hypothetical protein